MPPEDNEQNNNLQENDRGEKNEWFPNPIFVVFGVVIIAIIIYLVSLYQAGDVEQGTKVITDGEKERILADLQTNSNEILSEKEKTDILFNLKDEGPGISDEDKEYVLDSLINI
mgnify:CR=1 FL=1|jgi:hypothetical protein